VTTHADRIYTVTELLFSSGMCCRCGAGVAYPLDPMEALMWREWRCSAVLLGEAYPAWRGPEGSPLHDAFAFECEWFAIESESQPSQGGATSRRPDQGHVEVRSKLTCLTDGAVWHGPWKRPNTPRVWEVEAGCPTCGEPNWLPDGSTNYKKVSSRSETRVVLDEVPL